MNNNFIEIRCPYEKISRTNGQVYKCNSLCVKVANGSAGEARCRKCYANFIFVVSDGTVKSHTVQQIISANHADKK